ncbi:MAG: zinc ribbon domain-containing protein [Euryarchaeota archaeon]|nr:zinc ribbon domain-containing protein [Euryarchaeota archaeon]MDE1838141.1 zinc ribbon domain-containing protein [Euryarchaeota archaeon]MDE2046703.1 zinc ribbon domain-containing protein [Thermoplasmata archaeon]
MPPAFPGAPAPLAYPLPPWRSPASGVSTAETLVLVALVLQVIGAVALGAAVGAVMAVAFAFPFAATVAVVALLLALLAVVVLLYFGYTSSYLRIKKGDLEGAKTPTLVLGVVGLFLMLVPGILYLIAFFKLDSALELERWNAALAASVRTTPQATMNAPYWVGMATVTCATCHSASPLGYAFCPRCGGRLG